MILSRLMSVAVFTATVGLMTAGSPTQASAQIVTPLTGKWVSQSPSLAGYLDFYPGQYAPSGGVIGQFSLSITGPVPFMRYGGYSFTMVNPGLAFVKLSFSDNGEIENAYYWLNGEIVFRNFPTGATFPFTKL